MQAWFTRFTRITRLAALFSRRPQRFAAELSEEMEAHIEAHASVLQEQGLPCAEATRRARIAFGNPHLHAEHSAEQWQLPMLVSICADIQLALHKLRKAPGYTVIAILTLAIGIGATTTIFTIVNVAMLRSLPVRQPGELVSIGIHVPTQSGGANEIPWKLNTYLQAHAASFSALSGWNGNMVAVRDPEGSLRSVFATLVSGNGLPMLGVSPYLGRLIQPSDDVPGGPEGGWPVVLQYDYWKANFHADQGIVGKHVTVSGHSAVIVGVLPPGFNGLFVNNPNKLYLPLHFTSVLAATQEQDPYLHPEQAFVLTLGRLAPNVTLARANLELVGTTAIFHEALPPRMRSAPFLRGATVAATHANRGFSMIQDEYGPALLLLQGIVLLVLLLCCINLGGLQLARVQRHQHEYAIRAALGASRLRILRQCLTESLLLAFTGSLFAAAIAWTATPILGGFLTPAGSGEQSLVHADTTVLVCTTALAVLSTLLFGLLPALRAGRTSPASVLKGQGTHRRSSTFSRNLLVSGQFALALVLVFGAGLFTQTLTRLRHNHAGFQPANILMVTAQFQLLKKTPDEVANIYRLMTEKLRASPGMQAAAYTWVTPLTGFAPKLNVANLAQSQNVHAITFNEVGDGYFSTVGTHLLSGREFTTGDRDRSTCVLNQAAARTLLGQRNPVGETLKTQNPDMKWTATCRVVGIVQDARYASLRDAAPATLYFPAGAPALAHGGFDNNFVFFLRAARPADAMAAYRAALAQYAPDTAFMTFLPLQQQVDQSLGSERLLSLLSSAFAGVALLLSAIGIFGLLALRVQQRTQEIGVRMAIGATRVAVLRMVLAEASVMVTFGTFGGIVLCAVGSTAVRRFLYGISPSNPWLVLLSIGVLFFVGIVASVIPAHRAARLNPMLALRSE